MLKQKCSASYGCHFYFLLPISFYLQDLGVSQAPLTTGVSTRVTICLAPAFSALSLEPESSTTAKRWTTLRLKQSTAEKTPWALPFVENKEWKGEQTKEIEEIHHLM